MEKIWSIKDVIREPEQHLKNRRPHSPQSISKFMIQQKEKDCEKWRPWESKTNTKVRIIPQEIY